MNTMQIISKLELIVLVLIVLIFILRKMKTEKKQAQKAGAQSSSPKALPSSQTVSGKIPKTVPVSPDKQCRADSAESDDRIHEAVRRIVENTDQASEGRPAFRHENLSVLAAEKNNYNFIELRSITPADHSWDIVKMGFDKETREVIYQYGRQVSRGFFLDGEWETVKKDFAQLSRDTRLDISAENCDDFVPEDRKAPWSPRENPKKKVQEVTDDECRYAGEPDILAYYSVTTRRFGASVSYIRRCSDGYRAFRSINAVSGASFIGLQPLPSEKDIDHYMDHAYRFDSYDRLLTEKEVRYFHRLYHDSKQNDDIIQNDLYGSGRTEVFVVRSDGRLTRRESEPTVRTLRLAGCIDGLATGNFRIPEDAPKPVPVTDRPDITPICLENNRVLISSDALQKWLGSGAHRPPYRCEGFLPLQERTPVVDVLEDGRLTRRFVLETEEGEDLSGKYLQFTALAYRQGAPAVTAIQMDGLVTENADKRKNTMHPDDIAYRFEIYFLQNDSHSSVRYHELEGQGLENKALKLAGLITPVNVRSVAWCSQCGHSYAFRTYNFPAIQAIPIYSDDGQEVTEGSVYEIGNLMPEEKFDWVREIDGIVFRYSNTLRCPRCGHPYFDYSRYPELHSLGELGCVLIGKKIKPYQEGAQ